MRRRVIKPASDRTAVTLGQKKGNPSCARGLARSGIAGWPAEPKRALSRATTLDQSGHDLTGTPQLQRSLSCIRRSKKAISLNARSPDGVSQRPSANAGTAAVSMNRSSRPMEKFASTGNRFPRRFVFVVGCGPSGSTVLTMILGVSIRRGCCSLGAGLVPSQKQPARRSGTRTR